MYQTAISNTEQVCVNDGPVDLAMQSLNSHAVGHDWGIVSILSKNLGVRYKLAGASRQGERTIKAECISQSTKVVQATRPSS
jgi:hypothetical protein